MSRLAVLGILVACASPLAAQGGGRMGGGRNVLNADTLTAQYNLTADQKTKTIALIKTYNDSTAATMAWMRSEQQAGASRNADSAKKVTAARTTFDAAFKVILVGPQIARFDSIQAARAARGRGPGGGT
jgi:hypothetical protein